MKSRLNRLERDAGPPGTCFACKGHPDGGMVVVERDFEGREVSRSAPGRCRYCGEYGPSPWIIVDPRPFPRPKH